MSKFEAALAIDSRRHDALWCLGNALTSQGFLFADRNEALEYFERARGCFQRAVDEEPDNEVYRKALEMTSRAPALHAELQKQFAAQQQAEMAAMGGGAVRRVGGGGERESSHADPYGWAYDLAGYVILVGIAVAWTVAADRAAK